MKKQKFAMILGVLCLAFVVIFVVITAKENRTKEAYQTTGFVMGTVVTATVYSEDGEADAAAALDAIAALDTDVLSWRKDTSEVYKINHIYEADVPYAVSKELASYILFAKEIGVSGDGRLDITIRPLADVWGIENGATDVPDSEKIETAISFVDMTKVHILDASDTEIMDANTMRDGESYFVLFDEENMSLDFGAIGKGIACNRASEVLAETDAKGACIAVGGSILCYGAKSDGTNYQIGIRDPRGEENDTFGILSVDASSDPVSVSTSGDYEKYFIQDGKRYHHILDPATGYPADTGTISATAVCKNGALSDALSTLCILLDRDRALALVADFGAEAVLVDEEKHVYTTDGIRSVLTISNEEYELQ